MPRCPSCGSGGVERAGTATWYCRRCHRFFIDGIAEKCNICRSRPGRLFFHARWACLECTADEERLD